MAINPQTGEFEYDVRPMPGPGNSNVLGALLGIMNILKGNRLAGQSEAVRRQGAMTSIAKAADEGLPTYETPEGLEDASKFGISSETIARMGNTPESRVRSRMIELPPDATLDDQMRIYSEEGVNPPPGFFGYGAAQTRAQITEDKSKRDAASKLATAAGTIMANHLRGGATQQQALDAASRYVSTFTTDPARREQILMQAQEEMAHLPNAALPVPESRAAVNEATADLRGEQATTTRELRPGQKRLIDAKTRLADATAKWQGIRETVRKTKALGPMTPAQKLAIRKELRLLREELAEVTVDIKFSLSPEEKSANEERLLALREGIVELEEELTAAPAISTGGAAGGGGGGHSFKTPADVAAAYKAGAFGPVGDSKARAAAQAAIDALPK